MLVLQGWVGWLWCWESVEPVQLTMLFGCAPWFLGLLHQEEIHPSQVPHHQLTLL